MGGTTDDEEPRVDLARPLAGDDYRAKRLEGVSGSMQAMERRPDSSGAAAQVE